MELNDYIVLLPHGKPILMVEKLLEVDDKHCKTECAISDDNPFLEDDSTLSEMACIELIAQTTALFLIFGRYGNKGYTLDDLLKIKSEGGSLGFLVTIRSLDFASKLKAGDHVTVDAFLDSHADDFYNFKGSILFQDNVIANGEITIYAE